MLTPNTAAHTPIARARCRGSVIVDTTIANATGLSIDPPTPWAIRAAISTSTVGASAHTAEAKPKTARPSRNTRRRPTRSAIAPEVMRKLASANV